MLNERDWLNMVMDRMQTKLRHSWWPGMTSQLHSWTLGTDAFADGMRTWITAVNEDG